MVLSLSLVYLSLKNSSGEGSVPQFPLANTPPTLGIMLALGKMLHLGAIYYGVLDYFRLGGLALEPAANAWGLQVQKMVVAKRMTEPKPNPGRSGPRAATLEAQQEGVPTAGAGLARSPDFHSPWRW